MHILGGEILNSLRYVLKFPMGKTLLKGLE